MIVGISIRNFKSIRKIDRLSLDRFHVLVGPNASGKSTFLDIFEFVRDCLENGPVAAVETRVPDFDDLTWMRQGGNIEIELWMDIEKFPEKQKQGLFHYRLTIGKDEPSGIRVCEELLERYPKKQNTLFELKLTSITKPQRLLGKTSNGTDFYRREKGNYQDSFVFGPDKLTLSLTPPDEERYPSANAVRRFLMQGIRYIQLNSRKMRQPCPATRPADLELDGSNIARVAGRLQRENHGRGNGESAIERWTAHLQYALPNLSEIGWDKRQPDNAEYITLKYDNGLECPGWLLSDGTLRMLALTLPAFLPPSSGIYMVEEPENGVHPKALDVILRSLSAIPQSQMLIATHSPFVVQQVGLKPLLCFSSENSQTVIVRGTAHPLLKGWDGSPDLANIFASGVLG